MANSLSEIDTDAAKRTIGSDSRRILLRVAAAAGAIAAGVYVSGVGLTWLRYGHPAALRQEDHDPLLDRYMPDYEVAERHQIVVRAPADRVFRAAVNAVFTEAPLIRAIFRAREAVLRLARGLARGSARGSAQGPAKSSLKMYEYLKSIGWGVLAEVPEREIVMGSATQPWRRDVIFHPIQASHFASWRDPGFVKIAWNLRVDPLSPTRSLLRTETRVTTTDRRSRAKFRRYWSFFRPGIILIRRILLSQIKQTSERLETITARVR